MMRSKWPKLKIGNGFSCARQIAVFTLMFSVLSSIGLAAEQATIAVKTQLKASAALLGGKALRDLEPGTAVNVISTKSTFSQVELVENPSVKGWVSTGAITRSRDLAAGIAGMSSAPKAVNSRAAIAVSKGAVAKGEDGKSDAVVSALLTGKAKSESVKKGVAAVGAAKPEGKAKAALEEAVGEDAGEIMDSAAEADGTAKFKGKSASALEKIEALKISESELSAFMKEGGLRSRLIRQ